MNNETQSARDLWQVRETAVADMAATLFTSLHAFRGSLVYIGDKITDAVSDILDGNVSDATAALRVLRDEIEQNLPIVAPAAQTG
jgi:hypothetical protein